MGFAGRETTTVGNVCPSSDNFSLIAAVCRDPRKCAASQYHSRCRPPASVRRMLRVVVLVFETMVCIVFKCGVR